MKFEITNIKPMRKNTLRGFFSLSVEPFEIEGLTYHIKGDRSWVNFPSKEYFDKETGEKKYWPIIRIPDDERYRAFQKWAVGKCEKLFKEEKETPF